MQGPTRTRRLSVAAMVSLVAFVLVAGAGVRSFWTMDELDFNHDRAIALNGGCLHYGHASWPINQELIAHQSRKYQVLVYPNGILGFALWHQALPPLGKQKIFRVCTPIWPLLLLLLIAPLRWLI